MNDELRSSALDYLRRAAQCDAEKGGISTRTTRDVAEALSIKMARVRELLYGLADDGLVDCVLIKRQLEWRIKGADITLNSDELMAKLIADEREARDARVYTWARECFTRFVDDLLDDCSWVPLEHKHGGLTVAGFFAKHRQLAKDLGLDWDDLVAQYGSAYEIERLTNLERDARR